MSNGWIDPAERLPFEGYPVLVFARMTKKVPTRCRIAKYYDGKWRCDECIRPIRVVEYWQHMPRLPWAAA